MLRQVGLRQSRAVDGLLPLEFQTHAGEQLSHAGEPLGAAVEVDYVRLHWQSALGRPAIAFHVFYSAD